MDRRVILLHRERGRRRPVLLTWGGRRWCVTRPWLIRLVLGWRAWATRLPWRWRWAP
jgi:hypothetical protein